MALIPDLCDLFSDVRHLKYKSKVAIIEATVAEWIQEVKDTPYHPGAIDLKFTVAVKRILNGACAHLDNASCAFIYLQSAGRMLGQIAPSLKHGLDKCVVEHVLWRMEVILDPKNANKWPTESLFLETHWAYVKLLHYGRYISTTLFDDIYLAYMKRFFSSMDLNSDSLSIVL